MLVRRSLYGSDFRERAPRADFDGICSADILTIREIPGRIADGFLIVVLYSKELWQFIVSNSTGSLTRRIKWKQLQDFEFLLPPLDVQQKLVDVLWAMEKLREAHEAGLYTSIEFLKALLELAKDAAKIEREVVPEEEVDHGKAALTSLFQSVRNEHTPIIVERIVSDIDGIVKIVRFPGWQNTSTGQKMVKRNLRDVIMRKYRINDPDVFAKAYNYVEQYY